ncbi:MAG: hypothetical protein Kow0080_36650 [Candidatus Promineifilaceae bacterium]
MVLTGLFNLFALLYVFRGVQLLVTLIREWQAFTTPPFTPHQKSLAEQASFYIAVPIGVLLHELLHAIPIQLMGGRVIEFAYRVFWGYVVPNRTFTPGQEWFISLAGTLGNLLFGLVLWLLLRKAKAASLRYFALRAFRFQVFFSLVYYPLFTLVLPIGDWRTIYNFQATPWLSGLTAVFHIIILAGYYWADRTGRFEMAAFPKPADEAAFSQLRQQAEANPQDALLQIRYIDTLRRGGAVNQASRQLTQLIQQRPNLAEAHLQKALLQSSGKRQIPPSAARSVEEALRLGLVDAANTAVCHQLLAQYHLDRNNLNQTLHHIKEALAIADQQPQLSGIFKAQILYLQAQTQRRLKQYAAAETSIQDAINVAQTLGNNKLLQLFQSELATIQNHASRTG